MVNLNVYYFSIYKYVTYMLYCISGYVFISWELLVIKIKHRRERQDRGRELRGTNHYTQSK